MRKIISSIALTYFLVAMLGCMFLLSCKRDQYVAPVEVHNSNPVVLGISIRNFNVAARFNALPFDIYLNNKFLLTVPGYKTINGVPYIPPQDSIFIRDTFPSSLNTLTLSIVNTYRKAGDTISMNVPLHTNRQLTLYTFFQDSTFAIRSNPRITGFLQQSQDPPAAGNFRINLGHFAQRRDAGNILINAPAAVTTYSLLFADGSIVPGLANVHYGNFSTYAELPYGVYSFRVRDDYTGSEVPYYPVNIQPNGATAPAPSAPLNQYAQNQFYYQEGSTYSIVTNSLNQSALADPTCLGCQAYSYSAEYADQFLDANSSTLRPGNVAQVTYLNAAKDGGSFISPTNGALPLGANTGIQLVQPGTILVKYQDADSTRQANYAIDRLNNWLIAAVNKPGYPGLLVFPTAFPRDTTPSSPAPIGGTPLKGGNNANLYVRFLNLSPDAGPVAFVGRKLLNGNTLETVIDPILSGHVSFGELTTHFPTIAAEVPTQYTRIAFSDQVNIPIHIGVRQAGNQDPQQPGPLIPTQEIDYPFVSNPAQFNPSGIYVGPPGFPGVYTVALVGSINPNAPASQQARIVVIKHSR